MKTDILGVQFDNYTVEESVEKAVLAIKDKKGFVIYTPNPEIVNITKKDKSFTEILNSADIVTPDGIGIVYASRLLKGNITNRAPGFDISKGIIEKLNESGGSVYLFGGKPTVSQIAADNLKKEYENLVICGTSDGYFDDDSEIIADISKASPDLLLVCLGAPKQEKWIFENKDKLNAGILIGAGGSIDVLAGQVKRAPKFYTDHGLEWFYRLINQPTRISRVIKLALVLVDVMLKGEKNNAR